MLWLATTVLATWLVEPRVSAAPPPPAAAVGVAAGGDIACDDGTWAGSLVQGEDAAYGNRFTLACASARLERVEFVYEGRGGPDTHDFRIRVLDAECNTLATSAVYNAPGWGGTFSVDVTSLAICVQSGFAVTIEPLDCSIPGDCFPAIGIDATSDSDPEAHCGVVAVLGSGEPQCLAPRSSDGRYFDFRIRATVFCDFEGCTTAVRARTWSHVKRLYGDPSGPTAGTAPRP